MESNRSPTPTVGHSGFITGYSAKVAHNQTDANLFEAGQHMLNVTHLFAYDLEDMIDDADYWYR